MEVWANECPSQHVENVLLRTLANILFVQKLLRALIKSWVLNVSCNLCICYVFFLLLLWTTPCVCRWDCQYYVFNYRYKVSHCLLHICKCALCPCALLILSLSFTVCRQCMAQTMMKCWMFCVRPVAFSYLAFGCRAFNRPLKATEASPELKATEASPEHPYTSYI